jgi:hypothetical protein
VFVHAPSLFAQQTGGEKELGIGGVVSVSHAASLDGNATGQFSIGKYVRRQHFLGVNLLPMVNFGRGTNSVGGFFGGSYRYLFGVENRRLFPFAGIGGGAFVMGGNGGNTTSGPVHPGKTRPRDNGRPAESCVRDAKAPCCDG